MDINTKLSKGKNTEKINVLNKSSSKILDFTHIVCQLCLAILGLENYYDFYRKFYVIYIIDTVQFKQVILGYAILVVKNTTMKEHEQ